MKRSSSISRLPVSRARASSTSRASSSTQPNTPSLGRSKSSLSLRRTPQSVQSSTVKTKKREVRPIQDKAWQAAALERTQHYFQQIPEGRQLLNKGVSIRPITLKMFVQLTNIVLNNIDPAFDDLTLSNYVELLPMHLNTLMYPGVITGSTLKTANTMHSWPHILAILAWLVELHELSMIINVEETILNIPPTAPFEEQVKKSELKIMFDFFKQFNTGKETDETQDKLIIENLYKKLCNYSEDDFEHYSKKINKLNEELQSAEEKSVNVQQACLTLEDECNKSADKLKHLNSLMVSEKQKKEDFVAEKTEYLRDIENIKRTCEKKENSIEKIKENLKDQPMNLLQRTNELKEIGDLNRQIELIKEEKKHQLNLRDEKDIELSEMKQKIEQVLLNYNIELMRPSLQHPELNQITFQQDKLLQPDMKEFISSKIEMKQQLFHHLELRIREAQETLSTIKLQKENKQQNISKYRQKIQNENENVAMLKKQLEALVIKQKQVEERKKDEINTLKQKLQALKDVNPNNVEHKLEQMKEVKTRCDELKDKLYSKHAKMEKFFEQIAKEIREKQIPRYENIRKVIVEKVDKAVSQYSSPPLTSK